HHHFWILGSTTITCSIELTSICYSIVCRLYVDLVWTFLLRFLFVYLYNISLRFDSFFFFFFFSSRRRHTRSTRDWSSDVCSSDLLRLRALRPRNAPAPSRVAEPPATVPGRTRRARPRAGTRRGRPASRRRTG